MVDLSGTNPGGMRMRAGGMQTPRLGAAAGGEYVVGGWIALRAMADVRREASPLESYFVTLRVRPLRGRVRAGACATRS